jgi:hypothetical protein
VREELHPAGFEVVDVCLEMGGSEIARQYVEAAASTHPSLLDQAHELDARFGITNIPMVMWIDEAGQIVRPPERATPPPVGEAAEGIVKLIGDDGQREQYVARLRDWVTNGAASRYALSPDEVLAQSQASSPEISRAAAHFELAQQLWRQEGLSERALRHFNAAHELQPDNITYKRQAYSVVGVERSEAAGNDTEWGRFRQAPEEGEDWPFVSDFNKDLKAHDPELAQRLGLG